TVLSLLLVFFFSSRRRHTRCYRDWSSDVCSSDLSTRESGFRIIRPEKHTVISDGARILTIPRHNPINAFTMGGIVRDAGLTAERSEERRVGKEWRSRWVE